MNDEFKNDYKRASTCKKLLICRATGEIANESDYAEYRTYILDRPAAKELLPSFVRTSRDLGQFWQFIKAKAPSYAERRQFIWEAFRPLLDYLEKGEQSPSAGQISNTLKTLDPDNIHGVWTKAAARAISDPEDSDTQPPEHCLRRSASISLMRWGLPIAQTLTCQSSTHSLASNSISLRRNIPRRHSSRFLADARRLLMPWDHCGTRSETPMATARVRCAHCLVTRVSPLTCRGLWRCFSLRRGGLGR